MTRAQTDSEAQPRVTISTSARGANEGDLLRHALARIRSGWIVRYDPYYAPKNLPWSVCHTKTGDAFLFNHKEYALEAYLELSGAN